MSPAPGHTNIIDDLRLLQAPQPLGLGWWLVIALAVLTLVGLLLWRSAVARRAAPSPAAIQAATEDALAELEKLRQLLSMENSRPYAIQVSGVVRRYIERRFGIRAPRRSTEEFLAEARNLPALRDGFHQPLSEFLAACDFLKFARARAEALELEQIHASAVRFVTATQPETRTNSGAISPRLIVSASEEKPA